MNSLDTIPIIELLIALGQYTNQLDETLQTAVEAYCTPENLQRVISKETDRVLDSVIREQVKNWFIYGEGREVIKEAVERKLRDSTTWTPLDDAHE
jgi:hypothetical protein